MGCAHRIIWWIGRNHWDHSEEKSNVIPGVAIATALMPPVCTAGFGIATGQWSFVGGALYLYTINCVFISLATIIGIRILRLKPHSFADEK